MVRVRSPSSSSSRSPVTMGRSLSMYSGRIIWAPTLTGAAPHRNGIQRMSAQAGLRQQRQLARIVGQGEEVEEAVADEPRQRGDLVAGLTVMPEQPPTWIAGGLQKLADALLPLVMLAVGLSIRLRLPREELGPLATGLVLKLAVMPALALPLSLLFGMPPLMLRANVLESAMPTMVSAAALAMAHGLAPRLCAALVGYGIVACLATLPAWAWLLARFQA